MTDERIKRPSYQWYPGDFRRDTAVQACSFEARALWREMLDLMHDGEPYGYLTAGGVPITAASLARMVGKSTAAVAKWTVELESRKVFSRTDGDVIFSRRMVKDEHIRTVRANSGRLGGNPILLNQNTNQTPSKTQPLSTATCSLSSAEEPVLVAAYAQALSVRANQGLAEHQYRPQRIPRVLAGSASSQVAAEAIQGAGVPLDFAEAHVYQLAKSHGAEGEVRSLKYFSAAVIRAWAEFSAEVASDKPPSNGNHAPRPGIGGRAYLTTLKAIEDL